MGMVVIVAYHASALACRRHEVVVVVMQSALTFVCHASGLQLLSISCMHNEISFVESACPFVSAEVDPHERADAQLQGLRDALLLESVQPSGFVHRPKLQSAVDVWMAAIKGTSSACQWIGSPEQQTWMHGTFGNLSLVLMGGFLNL